MINDQDEKIGEGWILQQSINLTNKEGKTMNRQQLQHLLREVSKRRNLLILLKDMSKIAIWNPP